MHALQPNRALDVIVGGPVEHEISLPMGEEVADDGHKRAVFLRVALKPEYRCAVEAAIAAIPARMSVTARFWQVLTSTVAAFSISQQIRASRPPSAQIKRWERFRKDEDALHDKYIAAGWAPPEFDSVRVVVIDDKDGERFRRDDWRPTHYRLKRRSTSIIEAYKTANVGFKGNANMHREALFRWVLELWHYGLFQDLGITRDKATGTADKGPLFRFFDACTAPLLDEPLTPSGVGKVVDRLR